MSKEILKNVLILLNQLIWLYIIIIKAITEQKTWKLPKISFSHKHAWVVMIKHGITRRDEQRKAARYAVYCGLKLQSACPLSYNINRSPFNKRDDDIENINLFQRGSVF